MKLLAPQYYHISVMGAIHCVGISSREHKPSRVRDTESWEGFQISFF